MRKETALKGRIVLAAALFVLVISGQCLGNGVVLEEASGITRLDDDHLLIVSDEDSKGYYRLKLSGHKEMEILIDPSRLDRVQLPLPQLPLDLESIGVLADERVVVLSERLHALIGEEGVIVDYDSPLTEIGNRGLEGLAIRHLEDKSSYVAVLWEGGYPVREDMPLRLPKCIGRHATRPVIFIHLLGANERLGWLKKDQGCGIVDLEVPQPSGQEPDAQRFRAPDLVWHKLGEKEWGFIVLLSSQNSPESGKPEYLYKWLQQFTIGGKPVGEPLDIDSRAPEELKGANWEGLGWFEQGKSLMLINDVSRDDHCRRTSVITVELPDDWKW
jgi:hypothetical protein